MGVGTGLAAFNRHKPTSVRTGQDGRKVQIEEVALEWRAVRDLGGRAGTDCQDFVRTRPVKREFQREHLGVRGRFHTLADDGDSVVHHPQRSKVPDAALRLDKSFYG